MGFLSLAVIGISLTTMIYSIMAAHSLNKEEESCGAAINSAYLSVLGEESQTLDDIDEHKMFFKKRLVEITALDRMCQIVVFTALIIVSAVFSLKNIASRDSFASGLLTFLLVALTAAALVFQTLAIGVHTGFPYKLGRDDLQHQLTASNPPPGSGRRLLETEVTGTLITACEDFTKRRNMVFIFSIISLSIQGLIALVGHGLTKSRCDYDRMTHTDIPAVCLEQASMPSYPKSRNGRSQTFAVCSQRRY